MEGLRRPSWLRAEVFQFFEFSISYDSENPFEHRVFIKLANQIVYEEHAALLLTTAEKLSFYEKYLDTKAAPELKRIDLTSTVLLMQLKLVNIIYRFK